MYEISWSIMIERTRIRYASIIVTGFETEILACAAKHLRAYTSTIFAMGYFWVWSLGWGISQSAPLHFYCYLVRLGAVISEGYKFGKK